MSFDANNLRPGDVLLYRGKGLYAWAIFLKTWHKISHVEVYVGGGKSFASRDGQGVNIYPLRTDITYVLRPTVPIDLPNGLGWAAEVEGTPYGWLDLLQFVGIDLNAEGIVCSPAATKLLRVMKVPVFKNEMAEKIAPSNFLLSELFDVIYAPDIA